MVLCRAMLLPLPLLGLLGLEWMPTWDVIWGPHCVIEAGVLLYAGARRLPVDLVSCGLQLLLAARSVEQW